MCDDVPDVVGYTVDTPEVVLVGAITRIRIVGNDFFKEHAYDCTHCSIVVHWLVLFY